MKYALGIYMEVNLMKLYTNLGKEIILSILHFIFFAL